MCYSVIAALVYHIWRARNYAYWNDVVPRPAIISRNIKLDVCGRIKSSVDVQWNERIVVGFNNL